MAWDWFVHSTLLIAFVCSILLVTGCEKKNSSIIDPGGTPPVLLQVSLSPAAINSDSINVGTSRRPDDVLPLAVTIIARLSQATGTSAAAVRFLLKNPGGTSTISTGELLDDGQGVDIAKGDGIYTGKVTFQIKRVEIGTFTVEVAAEADNGFQSNTVIAPFSVFRGNRPPGLSDLQAPDTVQLGNQTQLLTLRVRANDPDGLADVAKVVFNSFKPDGSPSGGNPFQMFDDGAANHGDENATDGIYSLIVSLPPNVDRGRYRFEFQAFDRSNEGSDVIVHRITVKQ